MRCITSHVQKEAHEEGAWSCCWVPGDSRAFVTGAVDETVKLWGITDDGITNKKTFAGQAGHTLGVISVAVDPSGEWAAASALDSFVRVWSLQDQSCEKALLESKPTEIWSVAFSPLKGKCIVAGAGGSTGKLKLWDVTSTAPGSKTTPDPSLIDVREAGKGADFVLSVAFSPDGRLLACGCMDGSVAVVDVESQSVKSHLAGHFKPVRSVTFTPDSKQVLTASDDMQLHLYEATGDLIEAFSGHESWVLDVAAHPNGTNFLSGSSDSSVKLWDIPQRTCVMTQREHTDQVWSVALNTSGSEAVSCGDDGRVVSYNLQG